MTGPHCEHLNCMASQIDILPHPANQSFLSTQTDTASCAGPMRQSVRFLSDSYVSPSPQSIHSFYTDRHHILRRSCESVCLGSSLFVRFPCVTLTPLTTAPLYLSVLVGGLALLPGSPCAPLTPLPRCICLSWFGGLLLIPGPPNTPPTMLSLSILVGRDGFYHAPLGHPQLRRNPCSDRKIQLTPQIPT